MFDNMFSEDDTLIATYVLLLLLMKAEKKFANGEYGDFGYVQVFYT